jgi:hypothetical protein
VANMVLRSHPGWSASLVWRSSKAMEKAVAGGKDKDGMRSHGPQDWKGSEKEMDFPGTN